MARILLVEDDPDTGPLLLHILLHSVHAAESCTGAMASLDAGTRYDLVIPTVASAIELGSWSPIERRHSVAGR